MPYVISQEMIGSSKIEGKEIQKFVLKKKQSTKSKWYLWPCWQQMIVREDQWYLPSWGSLFLRYLKSTFRRPPLIDDSLTCSFRNLDENTLVLNQELGWEYFCAQWGLGMNTFVLNWELIWNTCVKTWDTLKDCPHWKQTRAAVQVRIWCVNLQQQNLTHRVFAVHNLNILWLGFNPFSRWGWG